MKIIKNGTDLPMLEDKEVRIGWVRLGEGCTGDFDPEDPEDVELLRFDLYLKDEDGNWPDEPNESRCTSFEVTEDADLLWHGLVWLCNRFRSRRSKHPEAGIRNAADLMSYVCHEDAIKQRDVTTG